MSDVTLLFAALFLITATIIVSVLYFIQSFKTKKVKNILTSLEVEKNKIDSVPIKPELTKIESFLKNEKIEGMYNDWKIRLDDIKTNQIPKVNDLLIDADYSIKSLERKTALSKLALLEIEIYKVRENSQVLLNEIKEITTSEERNRNIVTKLKVKYRELITKFVSSKVEYSTVAEPISMQFENINKRFEDFEVSMENKDYTEVTKIIKAIDEMLKHMTVVIDEVPTIMLIATSILPKRIKEATDTYDYMVKNNYPLDYLNVEENIKEANKKIEDITSRARVLNLEDSLFELRILLEYFDSLFNEFEKEKQERYNYDENSKMFEVRLEKMNNMLKDIFSQINDIKTVYNLSSNDLMLLGEVDESVRVLNEDYKILTSHTKNNTFAYSHLTKDVSGLLKRLIDIEERLDNSLDAIGTMKEDEIRARQQLEEIKNVLMESNRKTNAYNLPAIPTSYKVEMNEAYQALKEIVKELDKKPITISVLNTRVDTARDLALKFYNSTKNLIKDAKLAELAIVYGNRYRSTYADIDRYLNNSEILFSKGDYLRSLETSVNGLNKIEPDIYQKINALAKEDK